MRHVLVVALFYICARHAKHFSIFTFPSIIIHNSKSLESIKECPVHIQVHLRMSLKINEVLLGVIHQLPSHFEE